MGVHALCNPETRKTRPLMDSEIRSAFLMTEPPWLVDATNIETSIGRLAITTSSTAVVVVSRHCCNRS
jgi:hypothetical protein